MTGISTATTASAAPASASAQACGVSGVAIHVAPVTSRNAPTNPSALIAPNATSGAISAATNTIGVSWTT